jgi:hypothetical protein
LSLQRRLYNNMVTSRLPTLEYAVRTAHASLWTVVTVSQLLARLVSYSHRV